MKITPIPCLRDNYAYLVECPSTRAIAIVDPSEAAPVIAALEKTPGKPVAVWCTHHHPDHVGGVADLVAHFGADLAVIGHATERARIPHLSRGVEHGERWTLGTLGVAALHVPAHTTGAIAFVVSDRAAFTGDTMFVAGCGRLFEGTAAMMHRALHEVFGTLEDEVEVYPGHEYAEKNLRFAALVEPGNRAVRAKLAAVSEQRTRGLFCVPSTMGDERATNPFVRVRAEGVRAFAKEHGANPSDAVEVLAAVRNARDVF